MPKSVSDYLDAFDGEFDDSVVESDYPYRGSASNVFQYRKEMVSESSPLNKICNCWVLKDEYALNSLTADILAAAELMGGVQTHEFSPESPAGVHSNLCRIEIALLDGGVDLVLKLWEDEATNKMQAEQRTTIRGTRAFCALLDFLGFDWLNDDALREVDSPTKDEINMQVGVLIKSGDELA
ncbi:hypothetical protein OAM00_02970 [Verrucomicrobia bacterium]|nr:hypothetical protein [Verrucomicrobiota bacterium]